MPNEALVQRQCLWSAKWIAYIFHLTAFLSGSSFANALASTSCGTEMEVSLVSGGIIRSWCKHSRVAWPCWSSRRLLIIHCAVLLLTKSWVMHKALWNYKFKVKENELKTAWIQHVFNTLAKSSGAKSMEDSPWLQLFCSKSCCIHAECRLNLLWFHSNLDLKMVLGSAWFHADFTWKFIKLCETFDTTLVLSSCRFHGEFMPISSWLHSHLEFHNALRIILHRRCVEFLLGSCWIETKPLMATVLLEL